VGQEQGVNGGPEATVKFNLLELQVLEQLLRTAPITGTADILQQTLPIYQVVREKVVTAMRALVTASAEVS